MQWLAKVQRVVPWKDNTADAPTFVETKTAYPIRLRLPAKAKLDGRLSVSVSVPGKYVLERSKADLKEIQHVAAFGGRMMLLLDYYPTETKWPPRLGFNFRENQIWVTFQTGLRFEDVEASCEVFRALFSEFGVDVRIRKFTEQKVPWRSTLLPVTSYGISEGYQLEPGRGVELKQFYPGPGSMMNPDAVEFRCPALKPGEVLLRFSGLIERGRWPVGKGHLILSAEGKGFKGRPERTARFVEMLNALDLPCRRANLDLWYTLGRWQDFTVLPTIAGMDVEGSPAEIPIWRIDLGKGLQGFVEISATRKIFSASAYPVDSVANDDAERGRFYAEWGKRLTQIR